MLYIHIGFHKTGSSTIQRFMEANEDLLAAHGRFYSRIGRRSVANFNLSAELHDKPIFDPKFGTWSDLIAEVDRHPQRDIVISSEAFSSSSADDVRKIGQYVGGRAATIVAYIRDWVDTIPSKYAQQAKSGIYAEHFDRFFAEKLDLIEAGEGAYFESLGYWAEAFGWDALRVRSLDPRSLAQGDLLSDFLTAIALDPALLEQVPPETLTYKNVAPGWKTVELLRRWFRLHGGRQERGKAHRIRTLALRVGDELGHHSDRGKYLTRLQWRRCRAQYVKDVKRLNERLAVKLPLPDSSMADTRTFFPTIAAIDEEERQLFDRRMRELLAAG